MNGDKGYSKLPAFDPKPILNSIKTKLNKDVTRRNGSIDRPGTGQNMLAQKISAITSANISDANSLEQILPESAVMRRISISSILSPKDFMTVKLSFGLKENSIFKSQLVGPLFDVLQRHFIDSHKIEAKLPAILEDILFKKGSYPVLTIPESSIDYIINGAATVSRESLTASGIVTNAPNGSYGYDVESIGILGDGKTTTNASVTLEAFLGNNRPQINGEVGTGLMLTVTDNPVALKVPLLAGALGRQAVLKKLGKFAFGKSNVSLEAKKSKENSTDVLDNAEIEKLYKKRSAINTPLQVIPTIDQVDRKTVGHPLRMVLPAESVIPVHVPGEPSNHVGYYILLDQNRNPVASAKYSDGFRNLEQHLAMNNEQVNAMITSNFQDLTGRQLSQSEQEKQEQAKIYAEMMEAALLKRLTTGVMGDNVAISQADEFYRIMLTRWLFKQQTIALYVPAEMMTYYAFGYNEYGVGESLTDQNKILGSIRAMLLFANTMAGVKNAVGRTRLKISLDEDEDNAEEAIHFIVDHHMRNRGNQTPFGTLSLPTIADYMNVAGVEVEIDGNSKFPMTKSSVEDFNSQKQLVDTTLEEDMRRRWIMGHEIPPELVDQVFQPEFATTFLSQHQIFAQSCMEKQQLLCEFLTADISNYALMSQIIRDELKEAINDNIAAFKKAIAEYNKDPGFDINSDKEDKDDTALETIVDLFLDSFKVTLPKPDLGTLENQKQALQAKSEFYDTALDFYVSQEAFDSGTFTDIGETIPMIKAILKMILMREFMRENNILPELDRIVSTEEDGTASLDLAQEVKQHLEGVMRTIGDWAKELKKLKPKMDKINADLDVVKGNDAGDTDGDGFDQTNGNLDGGEDDLDASGLDDVDDQTDTTDSDAQDADNFGSELDDDTKLDGEDELDKPDPSETDDDKNKK